jgi:hypothetical protein
MPIEWHFINHKQGHTIMKNYFEDQKIHWNAFAPENIVFKSNNLTKKLLPAENILSYKTKTDRDNKMCEKLGGQKQTHQNWNNTHYSHWSKENYKAIHVKLNNVNDDYPCADIDFINYTRRIDSSGAEQSHIDILVYITSRHFVRQWQKDANGNWGNVNTNTVPLPDLEGYQICYGGQGASNPLTHQELIEIADVSQAVINFLANKVLPLKNGTLVDDLQLVA